MGPRIKIICLVSIVTSNIGAYDIPEPYKKTFEKIQVQAHKMYHQMFGGSKCPGHCPMHGMYGRYEHTRESSGTSWTAESIALPGIHTMKGPWAMMSHGYINGIFDTQSGRRGGKKVFSTNMLMATVQRDFGCVTTGLRGMISLEPATIGKRGYPLLLQTGETANGRTPLIDRQHPHNFFMELAATASVEVNNNTSLFAYFGLPGEPALGPPVYMQRFSAYYNPEAPISHHWMDSTHITFGVATVGLTWKSLKIDTSLFTGREPDQHRWGFQKPRFDSWSVRATVNPTKNSCIQLSHGFLKSPEQLEPCVNIHRTVLSLIFNKTWEYVQWQTMIAWGQNNKSPGEDTNALLIESTAVCKERHVIFARAECVEKDELFKPGSRFAGMPFSVGKMTGGYVYMFARGTNGQFGVGASAALNFVPCVLQRFYGKNPWGCMLFVRAELKH